MITQSGQNTAAQVVVPIKQLLPAQEFYADEGPNEQLRQHLLQQAKERGIEVELPAIATSLTAKPDTNFEYGARLDLGEFGEIYCAPILQNSGNFEENDPGLIQRGVPDKLGEGSRNLYAVSSGLRRLCRDRGLFGVGVGLPDSNEAGRVNFVKFAEGERKNL